MVRDQYGERGDGLLTEERALGDFDGLADPRKGLRGGIDDMRATVAELEAIGVSHLLLDPVAPGGGEGRLAAVERFAAELPLNA